MCERYALHLGSTDVWQIMAEDDMVAKEAPPDDGPDSSRQTYNFSPSLTGLVFRANTPDWGAEAGNQARYKLQAMRWGLIPSWTENFSDGPRAFKNINCRADALGAPGQGYTMKERKRCVVIAEGFFKWQGKQGAKPGVPHYVKRVDRKLMCFAGIWDYAQHRDSDDKIYSYCIITTSSNEQLKPLHDYMPVILDPGSWEMRVWLDPGRREWTAELQDLLKPYDGPLMVYRVSDEVNNENNNSEKLVMPIDVDEEKGKGEKDLFAKAVTMTAGKETQRPAESSRTGEPGKGEREVLPANEPPVTPKKEKSTTTTPEKKRTPNTPRTSRTFKTPKTPKTPWTPNTPWTPSIPWTPSRKTILDDGKSHKITEFFKR